MSRRLPGLIGVLFAVVFGLALMVLLLVGPALLGTAGSPAFAASTLSNAGFETGGAAAHAAGWIDYSREGTENAAYTEAGGHTGSLRLTHWSPKAYQVETYQYLTGLGAGRFTLSVWTRFGGGRQSAYIAMRNCGNAEVRSPLPRTSVWTQVSVTGEVTAGQCTLSLISDAAGGAWANFDDVRFARIGGTTTESSGALGGTTTTAAAGSLRHLGPPGTPVFVTAGSIALTAIVSTVIWRRRMLRPVRELADSLHRGEEQQRRIVADVAHGLRAPLSTVRSYLEALIDGVLPADKEVFESLHEEAMLQQRIVDDLQDLTLAEAGKLTYHRDVLDVVAVLRSCATAADLAAVAAGVRLTVRQVGPVQFGPVQVHADPDRLRQVIGNLLGNALRHTPVGGRISLEAGPGDRSGKVAIIKVTDTGTGIAADDLPHVFDRFWRAAGDRGHPAGGSGLGLAIARQIVGDQGGSIAVRSMLGAGTTFTLTLPAVRGLRVGRHRSAGTPFRNR